MEEERNATGPILGVKIRNLKVDFKTRGTWHRVGIFFIRLSRLVSKRQHINKNLPSSRFETKRISRTKKIINIHYQCSLPDLTPSASSLKINFQISDYDT